MKYNILLVSKEDLSCCDGENPSTSLISKSFPYAIKLPSSEFPAYFSCNSFNVPDVGLPNHTGSSKPSIFNFSISSCNSITGSNSSIIFLSRTNDKPWYTGTSNEGVTFGATPRPKRPSVLKATGTEAEPKPTATTSVTANARYSLLEMAPAIGKGWSWGRTKRKRVAKTCENQCLASFCWDFSSVCRNYVIHLTSWRVLKGCSKFEWLPKKSMGINSSSPAQAHLLSLEAGKHFTLLINLYTTTLKMKPHRMSTLKDSYNSPTLLWVSQQSLYIRMIKPHTQKTLLPSFCWGPRTSSSSSLSNLPASPWRDSTDENQQRPIRPFEPDLSGVTVVLLAATALAKGGWDAQRGNLKKKQKSTHKFAYEHPVFRRVLDHLAMIYHLNYSKKTLWKYETPLKISKKCWPHISNSITSTAPAFMRRPAGRPS